MKIHVGSQNETKVAAVQQVFPDAEVLGKDAAVEEFGHPKSLDETMAGAKSRADAVFTDCDLAIGIESGLLEARGSTTGYVEITVCSIFNGQTHAIGMGPAFEWPRDVLARILAGADGSQAFREAGLTDRAKLGAENGVIHYLSSERVTRQELNVFAIKMALVQVEHPELYYLEP